MTDKERMALEIIYRKRVNMQRLIRNEFDLEKYNKAVQTSKYRQLTPATMQVLKDVYKELKEDV